MHAQHAVQTTPSKHEPPGLTTNDEQQTTNNKRQAPALDPRSQRDVRRVPIGRASARVPHQFDRGETEGGAAVRRARRTLEWRLSRLHRPRLRRLPHRARDRRPRVRRLDDGNARGPFHQNMLHAWASDGWLPLHHHHHRHRHRPPHLAFACVRSPPFKANPHHANTRPANRGYSRPPHQSTACADPLLVGCSSLVSVNLPAVHTIGGRAFEGCVDLTSISLPATKGISDAAFHGCSSLTSVAFVRLGSHPTLTITLTLNLALALALALTLALVLALTFAHWHSPLPPPTTD